MYTILIADDEEELRRAIIRKVNWEEIGFQVIGEAENGIEALELVEKLEPDLLLTDIKMPFISGIELARQVREVRPSTYIAFLSGFDDFGYARQAIEYNIVSYLLKPISMVELTQELVKIREKIDAAFSEFEAKHIEQTEVTDFLIPLLLDDFQNVHETEPELQAQAVSCGLLKETDAPPTYIVIITSLFDAQGKNCTSQGHIYSVGSVLRKYLNCASFYSGGRVISLLAGTPRSFDKYLHIALEEVIHNAERIMRKKCSIGVSRPAGRLSDCHEAYREAVTAGSYFEKTNSGTHFITDEEPVQSIDAERIFNEVTEVGNHIRSGSEQELTDYLKHLFDTARKEKMSLSAINMMLIQLLAEIYRIILTVTDSEKETDPERYTLLQQMLVFPGSLDEAENKFTAFCLRAREIISSQRKKSGTILCDRAIQMIEKEYWNPEMSLNYVSGQINVSPNYLSAMLKKNTGKSFVDLLISKRIDSAKDMLLSSSMKIREISEKCGYSDQHYFSYCFKKYTGLSPGAMRQQEQADNKEAVESM